VLNNPNFDRAREIFADQFTPDSGAFLYRKSMKGAPIRVSEVERDDFVTTFNRRVRYGTWAMVPAMLTLIGLIVWLIPNVDSAAAQTATWIGLTAIVVPFIAVYFWAWNAPARALERRPRQGAALSRDEVRQLKFSRMSYGQLGLVPPAALLLVWDKSGVGNMFHGWGIVRVACAGLLIAGAGVQAFRKWRYERA
jgi:hypothetical protein